MPLRAIESCFLYSWRADGLCQLCGFESCSYNFIRGVEEEGAQFTVEVISILWISVTCIRTRSSWSLNQTGEPRSANIGETATTAQFYWLGSIVLWYSTRRILRGARESVPSC